MGWEGILREERWSESSGRGDSPRLGSRHAGAGHGAFGFIGTAVGRRLALAGHHVVAVTSRPVGTPPTPLFPCQVVRADPRDEGSVRAALADARPDAVCHLAGLGKVSSSCHLFERLSNYWTVARRTGKQG